MKAEQIWCGTGFERATGKQLHRDEKGLALRRGLTVADELGKCNDRDREPIAGMRLARKTFRLGLLAGETARLCPYLACDRAGGQLEILVNGHPVIHEWKEDRPYWTDRWTTLEIPVSWLTEGDNDVCFRACDNSEWSLLIESSRLPNRSAVSEDGGRTWRSEDLGWNNGCDGEYMVRLWLDQYPLVGSAESEVFDLCRDPERDMAVSVLSSVSFGFDSETPEGCEVKLTARSGSTPEYSPESWSVWTDVASGAAGCARFAQWRLELTTADPNLTPVVKQVAVRVVVDAEGSARTVRRSQALLRRSSYRFAHALHDESRAERLRDRWHLEDVVRGAPTEFDAYLQLRQWVRNRWEDGWDMGGVDFCPPWDAMLILELTSRKLSLGMCTHYATVMSQCCAALGLSARTQIMRSHCINEVWSTDHQKWVAMDVGGDNNDETKFVYHFERDGVPLSAGECHEAWVNDQYDDVKVTPQPPPATKGRYKVEDRLRLFERFMISLRNDELRSLEPGESEHGRGSYHYDGYLFWEDEKTEALPWFTNHTCRSDDLYWSVNETYIHLIESDLGGDIGVQLESATPNLACFERSSDGEAWETVADVFIWSPERDGSILQARSVNHHDRRGVVSTVEVSFDD